MWYNIVENIYRKNPQTQKVPWCSIAENKYTENEIPVETATNKQIEKRMQKNIRSRTIFIPGFAHGQGRRKHALNTINEIWNESEIFEWTKIRIFNSWIVRILIWCWWTGTRKNTTARKTAKFRE